MVREYPALVITDARDLSKNSVSPAFAHLNLCPDYSLKVPTLLTSFFNMQARI